LGHLTRLEVFVLVEVMPGIDGRSYRLPTREELLGMHDAGADEYAADV
jgi:hypothetical protein